MGSYRHRCYESYASTHAGCQGAWSATALIYRRDIRPHLPFPARGHRILDIGCGRGELVALLRCDGFDARGVEISPEQVDLAHAAGVDRVELGDFHEHLHATTDSWDAILATDVLEHLSKDEVLRTFDDVHAALRPGGVFIARVPNAVSPVGGNVMYGDITHETWFTKRSAAQLAAISGFASIRVFACPPVVHGLRSAARVAFWKPISGLLKLMLIAETGEVDGHIVTQNMTFVATKRSSTESHAACPES